MSVKIRLQRLGRKDKPLYRIVVCDESAKRNGKVIENLGTFEPKTPPIITIDQKALEKWQSVGARPTEAVRKLINTHHV